MNKDVLAAQIRYHEAAAARLREQRDALEAEGLDLDALHPDDFNAPGEEL